MRILSQETYDRHRNKILGGTLTLIVAGAFGLSQMESETTMPIKVVAKGKETFSIQSADTVATFKGNEELVAGLETGKCYFMTTKGASVTMMNGSSEFRVVQTRQAPCPS